MEDDGVLRRIIACVWCHGDDVRGNWMTEISWFGYCLRCGCRFWHDR